MIQRAMLRWGATSKLVLLGLLSVIMVIALIYASLQLRPDAKRNSAGNRVVRIYCAAGIAKPVEQLIDSYNQQYGSHLELARIGGSGELAGLIQAEFESGIDYGADLYITADPLLLEKAHAEGIVAERFSLAAQKPVIAIAADSNLKIDGLRQMLTIEDIKFGIASERAAVGSLVRKIAQRDGYLSKLESEKTTDSENVMTLAQALIAGSLDAAVVWDTTVQQLNQENGVTVLKVAAAADPLDQIQSEIAIGVIARTKSPTECLKFSRYLTAPETGQTTFENYKFTFVTGDRWEEVPELHLYFGSMFTPVLEEAVREFEQREGVNVYSRWEGCGKLVASMHAIEDPDLFPDAYMACDRIFLDEVKDHFQSPTIVSSNQIVMAVQKSVTEEINTPQDLLDKNLRIGICDPELSALGRLTKILLSETPYEGLYPKIVEQSAVTVDVGPTLISQLLAEGLDVAFVYRSNTMGDSQFLDSVRIVEFDPLATRQQAIQPWTISKSTENPVLMQRLYDWISRPEIQARFTEYGFQRK